MRRHILAAAAALAVGTTACVPKVEQPDVWLAGVRLASIGLDGGVVDVRLSVHNPNGFQLRTRDLSYTVELEAGDGDGWLPFTDGRLGELEVAAGDTAEVVVPVEFEYQTLGRALRGVLERGSFDYRVQGTVELAGPIRRKIPYRHIGTVTPRGFR